MEDIKDIFLGILKRSLLSINISNKSTNKVEKYIRAPLYVVFFLDKLSQMVYNNIR